MLRSIEQPYLSLDGCRIAPWVAATSVYTYTAVPHSKLSAYGHFGFSFVGFVRTVHGSLHPIKSSAGEKLYVIGVVQ